MMMYADVSSFHVFLFSCMLPKQMLTQKKQEPKNRNANSDEKFPAPAYLISQIWIHQHLQDKLTLDIQNPQIPGKMFGTSKNLLRRRLGVQIPTHHVFGCLGSSSFELTFRYWWKLSLKFPKIHFHKSITVNWKMSIWMNHMDVFHLGLCGLQGRKQQPNEPPNIKLFFGCFCHEPTKMSLM